MKFVLALLTLFSVQISLAEIDRKGNGGDSAIQEFVVSATQVFNFVVRRPDLLQQLQFDPNILFSKIRKVSVEAEDHLFLDGVEVDAINFPDIQKIQISRSRWKQISTDPNSVQLKRSLALHEYLWILGVNDTDYLVSAPIIAELDKEIKILQPKPSSRAMLTALCIAVRDRDPDTVRAVLQIRFDPNGFCDQSLRVRGGNVLDDLLMSRDLTKTFSPNELAILEALLFAGVDPNTINSFYLVPLLSDVIETGEIEPISMMIRYGANPNRYFRTGATQHTILTWSSLGFHRLTATSLSQLIDLGADFLLPVIADPGWQVAGGKNAACKLYYQNSKRTDLLQVLNDKLGFDPASCAE